MKNWKLITSNKMMSTFVRSQLKNFRENYKFEWSEQHCIPFDDEFRSTFNIVCSESIMTMIFNKLKDVEDQYELFKVID